MRPGGSGTSPAPSLFSTANRLGRAGRFQVETLSRILTQGSPLWKRGVY